MDFINSTIINEKTVMQALEKTKPGLQKYLNIQRQLANKNSEIIKSREFQKSFN